MTRNLVALISLSLAGVACSGAPKTTAPAPHTAAAAKKAPAKSAKAESAEADDNPYGSVENKLKVGDYVVQRITGSFSKEPLMLTRKIIARGEGNVTIDYTLVEGRIATRLRVKSVEATGHVLRVEKIDGGKTTLGDVNDFEAMMQKTAFSADENDGTVATNQETCLVGGKEVACEKTSYKVKVGDKAATLSIARSDAVPDQDVSGEIRTDDGNVVYHAQVIEVGNDTPGSGVASAE